MINESLSADLGAEVFTSDSEPDRELRRTYARIAAVLSCWRQTILYAVKQFSAEQPLDASETLQSKQL